MEFEYGRRVIEGYVTLSARVLQVLTHYPNAVIPAYGTRRDGGLDNLFSVTPSPPAPHAPVLLVPDPAARSHQQHLNEVTILMTAGLE